MSYFTKAIQELRSLSVSDYDERVEDICRELDDETMEEGGWPRSFFPEVLNLLNDTRFLSLRTSWKLLSFIRQNWQRLSPTEVSALKNILVDAFDKFGDFTGPLLVAEILGKFYPDENTLAALKTLNRISKPPARELVPSGFEMLAKTADDPTLRDAAIRELKALLNDDSEAVSKEAALSLSKIEDTN